MTITNPVLGQFDETMDLRLPQASYRVRFFVTDPAKASGLSSLRSSKETDWSGGTAKLV
jgi:hypothetical protein